MLEVTGVGDIDLECIEKSTVIMTYQSTSANFDYDWSGYKRGFGSITSNYWLGNGPISHITTKGSYGVRVDMWDTSNQYDFAEYHAFEVNDEKYGYRLGLSEYFDGSNGDGEFNDYRGQVFYTPDRDNGFGCAGGDFSGWWFLDSGDCVTSRVIPTGMANGSVISGSAVWEKDANISTSTRKTLSKVQMRIIPILHKSQRKI